MRENVLAVTALIVAMMVAHADAADVTVIPGVSFGKYTPARVIPPEIELVSVPGTTPELASFDWGPDVTVDTNVLYDFDADYDEESGWLWLATVPTADTSIKVYRSTDRGYTWENIRVLSSIGDGYFRTVRLVVGRGDSNFVYIFVRQFEQGNGNNGDVYLFRLTPDGLTATLHGVEVGPQQITTAGLTASRDTRPGYGLYVVYGNDGTGEHSFARSFDYGKTWDDAVVAGGRSYHLATGAERHVHLVGTSLDRKYLNHAENPYFGHPDSWGGFIRVSADTFAHQLPRVAVTQTLPENTATVWAVAQHDRAAIGSELDIVMAVRSHAWGDTWQKGFLLSGATGVLEQFPDIKAYRVPGADHVTAAFALSDEGGSDSANVYQRYADAGAPLSWSDPRRANDNFTVASMGARPVVVFSPGAPGTLNGGTVYSRSELQNTGIIEGVYFDAPWLSAIAEERRQEVASPGVVPNPARGEVTLTLPPSSERVTVHDAAGNLVREYEAGGGSLTWDGRDLRGREVAAGVYLVKLAGKGLSETRRLVLLR